MHRRSRQILKSTRLDVSAELFGYGRKSTALSKVSIDLPIPCCVIAVANECDELRELLRGERINGIFNFAQTHRAIVSGD